MASCAGLLPGRECAGFRTLLLALLVRCSALPASSQPVAETVEKPRVPLPLQPFTVELLDLKRGEWQFSDPLGQHLNLRGPVPAYAFGGETSDKLRLAWLGCAPEFPDDVMHAVLRVSSPMQQSEGASWFRVKEPYFSCAVAARPIGRGAFRCDLYDIVLGPATTGDRYVSGLYLLVGGRPRLLWLAAPVGGEGEGRADNRPGGGLALPQAMQVRLLTTRVGNVFCENERVRVTLVGLCPGEAEAKELMLQATDYASGEVVWSGQIRVSCRAGSTSSQTITVPLSRFGVFKITAKSGERNTAELRVCRIPSPQRTSPEDSAIGINIFQQQIWWYAYQVPLMAKAGVHWLRPWLAWENTWSMQEPEKGKWDTSALDAALRRMKKHSQGYQDLLFSAPVWVTGIPSSNAPPMAEMDQWSAYVEKVVRQYRGRIRHYEVWNEPDLMWPEETRHSGEHYLAMLKATWQAAKRADPGCVLLGLSHAGYEQWLENVGKLGASEYMDVATIHTYAPPKDFADQVRRRQEILGRYGMGRKTLWINELGATAYDFSPEYSAKFECSERRQAAVLVANYAQALSFDPKMKAFWFCTCDPRDAAHESQWTWDAGIGVLYLGFLPKLSYAALAGVAKHLDGKKCLGRANIAKKMHQVSFDGPLAVVWHDQPEQTGVTAATRLGCLSKEQVVVRDMFANRIASGKAGEIKLDLSGGPLYLEGSQQMAGIAQAEHAVEAQPMKVSTSPGGTTRISLTAPPAGKITVTAEPGLPASAGMSAATREGTRQLSLIVPEGVERTSGLVQIRVRFEPGVLGLIEPTEVVRTVSVTIGEPNLIRDGGFFTGNLLEWTPERTSVYAFDSEVGRAAPGSLRLDAPFDRRLVHWNVVPKAGFPVKLRCWVRTDRLAGCLVTLNLALFGPERWLTTWCLATNGNAGQIESGWRTVEAPGNIPAGTADWTRVETTLPAELIPRGTDRAAFFVDAKGDGQGRIWVDDLDLWQPTAK